MGSESIPDANDNGLGFGFSGSDVKRISEVVKRVEAQYRNVPMQRGRYPIGGAAAVLVPLQTGSGGIAAGSIGSPSSATVTKLVAKNPGPGFTTTGGTTVTMYSTFGTGFTGVKFCWGQYRDGFLYLAIGDC